jgi:hypothetical protein
VYLSNSNPLDPPLQNWLMLSGTIFVSSYILQYVCALFTPWCVDMEWDGSEQFQGADLLLLLMPPGEICPTPLCGIGLVYIYDVFMA